MASDDAYKNFDKNKIFGKSSGSMYLRPSNSWNPSVGLHNALKALTRPGHLEGANLTSDNVRNIEKFIAEIYKGKFSSHLTYEEKMHVREKLRSMVHSGSLSEADAHDVQAIIDHLSQ